MYHEKDLGFGDVLGEWAASRELSPQRLRFYVGIWAVLVTAVWVLVPDLLVWAYVAANHPSATLPLVIACGLWTTLIVVQAIRSWIQKR